MSKVTTKQVEIGQVYEKVGAPRPQWRVATIIQHREGPHALPIRPWDGGPVRLTWSDGQRTLTWSPGVQIMWMDGGAHRMCGRAGGHNH